MAENTQYTEDNIRSLDWKEHIRMRRVILANCKKEVSLSISLKVGKLYLP